MSHVASTLGLNGKNRKINNSDKKIKNKTYIFTAKKQGLSFVQKHPAQASWYINLKNISDYPLISIIISLSRPQMRPILY